MTKHLLAGVTAVVLLSGIASAQTYPPPTTPPEIPAPSMRVPAPSTSTTRIAPSPYGGYQATTTQYGVDQYGNPVTHRDIYREGSEGSSESRETFTIDPRAGGTTFQSTTTHNPP
jgi:hypothetical protein